jgi:hypothetical protein
MGCSMPMRRMMRLTSSSWFQIDNVTTTPDSPARAVRPERCR